MEIYLVNATHSSENKFTLVDDQQNKDSNGKIAFSPIASSGNSKKLVNSASGTTPNIPNALVSGNTSEKNGNTLSQTSQGTLGGGNERDWMMNFEGNQFNNYSDRRHVQKVSPMAMDDEIMGLMDDEHEGVSDYFLDNLPTAENDILLDSNTLNVVSPMNMSSTFWSQQK